MATGPIDQTQLLRVTMEQDYERTWLEGEYNIMACSWLAYWHLERSSFLQARKFLAHLVHHDKRSTKAWLDLCVCAVMSRNIEEGECALQEAVRLVRRPVDDVRVQFCRALLQERRGESNAAVASYNRIVRMCETGRPTDWDWQVGDPETTARKEDVIEKGGDKGNTETGRDRQRKGTKKNKNNYQPKKYKVKQIVAECMNNMIDTVVAQEPEKEKTPDEIAASLINILVNAFKAKHLGRPPNNEELECLFGELTEERINDMLNDMPAGDRSAPASGSEPAPSNPEGISTARQLLPLETNQNEPEDALRIFGGPDNAEAARAQFLADMKCDCLIRLAVMAHEDGHSEAAHAWLDAVEIMDISSESHRHSDRSLRSASAAATSARSSTAPSWSSSSSVVAAAETVAAAAAAGGLQIDDAPLKVRISSRVRANASVTRGVLMEDGKDYSAAEACYRDALEAEPEHFVALERSGVIYLHYTGLTQEAVMCLAKAVELNPMSASCWYLLGRCYVACSQYEDAKTCYGRSLNLDPNNENCWCSLGIVYYAYGMYREALGFFSRAIRINHEMCEAWYNVGALYDICGQKNEAEDAYVKARKYGFHGRLSACGLTLDMPGSALGGQRKKRKGPHELGGRIAAYHGDSTVIAGKRGLQGSQKQSQSRSPVANSGVNSGVAAKSAAAAAASHVSDVHKDKEMTVDGAGRDGPRDMDVDPEASLMICSDSLMIGANIGG